MGYYTEIQEIYVDSGTPSEVLTFYVGQPFTVHGWLDAIVGGYARFLANAPIEIYVDSTKVADVKTDGTGMFFAVVTINTAGTYQIYAKFPGTADYNPCESDKTTINVIEKPPTVQETQIVNLQVPSYVNVGASFTVEGDLQVKSTSQGIPNMPVALYVDGVRYKTVYTSSNGHFSITVTLDPSFAPGTHSVFVGFDGTDKYTPCVSETKTITVIGKKHTELEAIQSPDPVTVNVPFNVESRLLYYSLTGWVPLPGKVVSISFDGTKVADVTTDSEGKVKASITITSTGDYTIKMSFAGDNEYEACEVTKKITVSVGVGAIEGHVYYKTASQPLANMVVELEAPELGPGQFYKVYTDASGYYIFKNVTEGTHNISVPPQSGYQGDSATVEVKGGETTKHDFYLSKEGELPIPPIPPIIPTIPWWAWAIVGGAAIFGGVVIYKVVTAKPTVTVTTPAGTVKGKVGLE